MHRGFGTCQRFEQQLIFPRNEHFMQSHPAYIGSNNMYEHKSRLLRDIVMLRFVGLFFFEMNNIFLKFF